MKDLSASAEAKGHDDLRLRILRSDLTDHQRLAMRTELTREHAAPARITSSVIADAVSTGLLRLAHLAAEDVPDEERFVNDVLTLLAESLDVGVAFLSTVDGETLRFDAVYDRAGMGLRAGMVTALCDTY